MSQVAKLFQSAQAMHRKGKAKSALQRYDRVLALDDTHAHARLFKSLILRQQGRIHDATEQGELAASYAADDDAFFWGNYGVLLKQCGRLQEALAAYEKAQTITPDSVAIKSNVATLSLSLGRFNEAEPLFKELTELTEEPAPWLNLARMAFMRDDLDAVEEYLSKAQDLDPKHPDIFLIWARFYDTLHDPENAFTSIKRLLELRPVHTEAWLMLRKLSSDVLDLDFVERAARQLLTMDVQQASVLAYAVTVLRENLVWGPLDELEDQLAAALDEGVDNDIGVTATFSLLLTKVPQAAHRAAAETAWRKLTQGCEPMPEKPLVPREALGRKLRVGLLSYDLRQHAGATLLVGVIENLPKENIEWIAYSNSFDDDSAFRKRIRAGFDRFVNVATLSDEELAQRIRDDDIDVLIDRSGMTRGTRSRVLALRPAPVQIHWLAMPGSNGAAGAIDYHIADSVVVNEDNIDGFSENIIQLPVCYQPNDHVKPDLDAAGSRADYGLPDDKVVLCSFNQHRKISPDAFDAWAEIMTQADNTVLWLLDPGSEKLREQYRKHLEDRGIAEDRLIIAKHVPHAEHSVRIKHADLMLDNWPYGAHTTATDALRVGVPVITLPGSNFASRVAASILVHAGLPEWVVDSKDAYVHRAVEYASQSNADILDAKKTVSDTYWSSVMPQSKEYADYIETACLSLYDQVTDGAPRRNKSISSACETTDLVLNHD